MKENKNILNNNEKIYELKSEYMDDLVVKLDEQRPNNRKAIYIGFSLLLFLLIAGTVYWYPSNKLEENKKLVENTPPSLNAENQDILIINKEDDKQNLSVIITTNEEETSLITKTLDETSTSKPIKREDKKVSRKEPIDLFPTKKSPKKSNEKSVKKRWNKQLGSNEEKGLDSFKTQENKKKLPLEKIDTNTEKSSGGEAKETLNSSVSEKQKEAIKETGVNKKSSSSKNGTPKKDQISELEKDAVKDSIFSEDNIDTIPKESKVEKPDSLIVNDSTKSITQADKFPMHVDSSKSNSNWQLSLLAGTNMSFSRFSNSTNQEYLKIRKEEENGLVSFSGGVNIERFVNKNVKIITGLNYMTYGSKNNYSPMTSYKDSRQFDKLDSVYTARIDSIFYNPTRMWLPYLTGMDSTVDSSFVNNKVAYEDSTAFLNSGKVKFSYLEIPLMIGYYKTINKWSFGVNTGVGVGLLTRSSGYYIEENLTTIELASSQKIMWNFILGPEVNYNFKENYYLGIQSNFRLGLNNLSISEPIDRKYYNLQFSAKIGFRF